MLEEEATEPQAQQPPVRRRAASRPAGPPQSKPASEVSDSGSSENDAKPKRTRKPAAKSTAAKSGESTTKKSTAAKPATKSSTAKDAGDPESQSAASAASAPKRTRTRKPAAKAAADDDKVALQEAANQASAAEDAKSVKSDGSAEELAPTKPKSRRSTKAKQPTQAPSAEEATTDSAPASAEPSIAADEVGANKSQPKRTRNRKSTTQKAEDGEGQPEKAENADAETPDLIAEALRSAQEQAGARQKQPASREGKDAELAALAGAIAADDADQPDSDEATQKPAQQRSRKKKQVSQDGKDAELAALAGAIAADDDKGKSTSDQSKDDSETPASQDESATQEQEDSEDNSSDEDRPNRRRRRRGGRRRRRGGSNRESADAEDSDKESEEETSDSEEASPANGDDGEVVGTRRRRRRRRSSGNTEGGTGDDEITGIEGSTRMEAKRQRRKESRAAGRRRAPILSEAEFLARREAVDRQLVIRQGEDYTQLAVIEDRVLVEHYVDRASATSLIGNIYLGKVQNVLPSMEAAFIDIGRGRNAVLYAGEVDWDGFGVSAEDRKVEKVFKSGASVLVQVTKDPVGQKGARLTGHLSLPGRYIVYSPGGHLSGISRKLPETERGRLRDILGEVITDDESVIVRTAAEGVSSEELVRDVNRLKAQWEVIEKKAKNGKAPQALYSEPDLTLRIVRDLFTEDFSALVVQGDGGQEDAYEAVKAYVDHVAPHLSERVSRFETSGEGQDVFTDYRVDEQIAKALERKVFLPSGGSLVIDRTEAMTVIDVNTGRFTGSGGNLEATVTSNNLEAAEEIVRQLRLRDLGGIIVIDFIDMVLPSNRDLLLRRLVECLGRDRTRHQVAEVTSLGLVQLTRKRIGTGLAEAFTEPCEHCHGSGYLRHDHPVESQAPADGGERRNKRGGKRRS